MVKISKLLPLIIYFHRISCEDDVMTELFKGYDKAIRPNHSKYVQKYIVCKVMACKEKNAYCCFK